MARSESLRRRCKHAYVGTATQDELVAYKLYLDRRVVCSTFYRVRPTDRSTWLFGGKPVKLRKVRPASYCYCLEFEAAGSSDTRKAMRVYTDSWEPAALALLPLGRENPDADDAMEGAGPEAGQEDR